MKVTFWVKFLSPFIMGIGIMSIFSGILACENYPGFKKLLHFNCELGYYGLFLVIIGFALSEWSRKKMKISTS